MCRAEALQALLLVKLPFDVPSDPHFCRSFGDV